MLGLLPADRGPTWCAAWRARARRRTAGGAPTRARCAPLAAPYRISVLWHALAVHADLVAAVRRARAGGGRAKAVADAVARWATAQIVHGRAPRQTTAWKKSEWEQCPKTGCTHPPGHRGRCAPLRVGDRVKVLFFEEDDDPGAGVAMRAYTGRAVRVRHAWVRHRGTRQRRAVRAHVQYDQDGETSEMALATTQWKKIGETT